MDVGSLKRNLLVCLLEAALQLVDLLLALMKGERKIVSHTQMLLLGVEVLPWLELRLVKSAVNLWFDLSVNHVSLKNVNSDPRAKTKKKSRPHFVEQFYILPFKQKPIFTFKIKN